jgi:hypothetical protein
MAPSTAPPSTSKTAPQDDDWRNHYAWPQQNNNVLKTIQNGHRWGVQDQTPIVSTNGTGYYTYNETTKCESPHKGLATIVTAYYDIPSKHSDSNYLKWIPFMLECSDPMVIFVDPSGSDYTDWWQLVRKHRQHAPTILVPLYFSNLTMSTVFTNDFWKKYMIKRDRKKRIRKGSDVYKIWNEKIIMMREVARANPFDTELFFWVDAGYYRTRYKALACTPIVRNNITAKGVDPKRQLVYQMIHEWPTYEIAGGAWGGSADAINLHYQYYWKVFWYLTLYSDKECVGFEQRVFTWMCRSFPSLCIIQKSRFWFAMGQTYLRDADFDFLNMTITIPKDNTTTLPILTEDFNITFPREPVISKVKEIPEGKLSLEQAMNYTHIIVEQGNKKHEKTD